MTLPQMVACIRLAGERQSLRDKLNLMSLRIAFGAEADDFKKFMKSL
jgi:hypothetical protein